MPAPQGELLTVVIDGEEQEVAIEPRILSRKSIDLLFMFYRKKMRKQVWEDMAALEQEDLPESVKDKIRLEYGEMLKKCLKPGVQAALECLEFPEGLIIGLEANSNLTHENAVKAVNEARNLQDIYNALASCLVAEAEAIKN